MTSFERRARAAKVARMLVELPAVASAEQASSQADALATWPQAHRDCWALRCGAKSPSSATWTAFVAAARGRFARAA